MRQAIFLLILVSNLCVGQGYDSSAVAFYETKRFPWKKYQALGETPLFYQSDREIRLLINSLEGTSLYKVLIAQQPAKLIIKNRFNADDGTFSEFTMDLPDSIVGQIVGQIETGFFDLYRIGGSNTHGHYWYLEAYNSDKYSLAWENGPSSTDRGLIFNYTYEIIQEFLSNNWTTLSLKLLDEEGLPVKGAKIKYHGLSGDFRTNQNGVHSLELPMVVFLEIGHLDITKKGFDWYSEEIMVPLQGLEKEIVLKRFD